MSSQASSLTTPAWLARLGQVIRQAPALTAMVAIAIAGSGIAIYLTGEHYAAVAPVCTVVGPIDCASVLKSAYSVVPGTSLPITLPGLLWFLASGGLAVASLTYIWRSRPEPLRLRQAQVVWGFVGLATVLYLVFVEIVKLQHICEWCTGIHILVLATLLLALNRLQSLPAIAPARSPVSRSSAAKPAPKASASAPRATSAHAAPARSTPARTPAKHIPTTKSRPSSAKSAARKHR
jgi:uncharacterized membrane protein